jgi:hypothetical protein
MRYESTLYGKRIDAKFAESHVAEAPESSTVATY